VANHAEVEGLLGEGRVIGARVRNARTGEGFEIRARAVVNAAGVWASNVQGMATEDPTPLRPSKGVHLVFRPGAVRTTVGVTVPSGAHDHRYVFVVPWGDRVYAGTTDTAYRGGLDDARVDDADREYVLAGVREAFPGVTAADVVAEWPASVPSWPEGHRPARRSGPPISRGGTRSSRTLAGSSRSLGGS
jgi:glycerol-3-phosphate dehydrogenase